MSTELSNNSGIYLVEVRVLNINFVFFFSNLNIVVG